MKAVTLTIGTKTKKQLLETVKKTDFVRGLISEGKVSNERQDLELEIYTGTELGFVGIATRKQVYGRGGELGLQLCPPAVAFYLREEEGAFIAMEPIMADGVPRIFQSASDRLDAECCWVYAPSGYPELVWGEAYRWVFLREAAE